jgi:hypothetical protein
MPGSSNGGGHIFSQVKETGTGRLEGDDIQENRSEGKDTQGPSPVNAKVTNPTGTGRSEGDDTQENPSESKDTQGPSPVNAKVTNPKWGVTPGQDLVNAKVTNHNPQGDVDSSSQRRGINLQGDDGISHQCNQDSTPTAAAAFTGSGPEEQGRGEERDLKAVKADDAAVPVWLWNDVIKLGLAKLANDPALRGHSSESSDTALDVIREFLLARCYKLKATRTYFDHLREEHHDLSCPHRTEVTGTLALRQDSGGQCVLDADGHTLQYTKYVWRPRVGRANYKAWWNGFRDLARLDRDPGYNAIHRVADSSWWDWDAGSAPLYWRWPSEYREVIRDGLEIWFAGEKPQWRRPQRAATNEETRQKVIAKIAKVRKRKYISTGHVWSLTDFFSVTKGADEI